MMVMPLVFHSNSISGSSLVPHQDPFRPPFQPQFTLKVSTTSLFQKKQRRNFLQSVSLKIAFSRNPSFTFAAASLPLAEWSTTSKLDVQGQIHQDLFGDIPKQCAMLLYIIVWHRDMPWPRGIPLDQSLICVTTGFYTTMNTWYFA
jgi:hypothetical protein